MKRDTDVGSREVAGHVRRFALTSGTGMLVAMDGRVAWANPAAASLLGGTEGDLLDIDLAAVGVLAVLESESAGPSPGHLADVVAGTNFSGTAVVERLDGREVALRVEASSMRTAGQHVGYVSLMRGGGKLDDLRRLELSHARFGALATHAPVAVCVSDIGMRIAFANERMATTWGRSTADLLGTGWLDAVVETDRTTLRTAVARVLAGEEAVVTIGIRRPDGDHRQLVCRFAPVERDDRSTGFVGTAEDVTELRRHQTELTWRASHDPLTGLANRDALRQHCEQWLARGAPFALVFLDLDDFKLVNDGLGHAAGDELLRTIAGRLETWSSSDDLPCRLGGDEFVVVMGAVTRYRAAEDAARDLLARLCEPVEVDGRRIRVTASVGVVLAAGAYHDVDALLRDADIAMYEAKHGGKHRVRAFRREARERASTNLELMADLRVALDARRVGLAFQPIHDVTTGRQVAVEALLRYEHAVLGPIPPLQVVALAEQTGLHSRLGDAVLHNALAQTARWIRAHGPTRVGSVAVNVSASQLVEPAFADDLAVALAHHGVGPDHVTIEVTESSAMRDADAAVRALEEVAALGVGIAIDDFGTGHSALAYLTRLPFDVVKLDRAFVRDLPASRSAFAILTASIALADSLDAAVIVEGVETESQLAVVREAGARLVQGYLLGRPVPAAQIRWDVPRISEQVAS